MLIRDVRTDHPPIVGGKVTTARSGTLLPRGARDGIRVIATLLTVVVLVACSTTILAPATGGIPAGGTPTAAAGAPSPGRTPVGPTEMATVLSITDGDTIRIDRGIGPERLRYIGINAPEADDPGGAEATEANARLVEGREIVLERDISEVDRFGRLLRYVWIRDGETWTLVNLQLVSEGAARAGTFPPDVRYTDLLFLAERQARERGAGLWAP